MAPKKSKKEEPVKPEFHSLYQRREPLPAEEPPNTAEAEVAWKAGRQAFTIPFPEWNHEAVNNTEWKPNDTENLYVDDSFSAAALPEDVSQRVVSWRRAALVGEPFAPEEPAPVAKPPSQAEPPPAEPEVKPKGKADTKAKAKSKSKKDKEEEVPAVRTTAEQFADSSYSGEVVVVSTAEYRSREVQLSHDESAPAMTQAICSQFAIIAEHRRLLPRGYFLWELIYPQGEDGVPLYNPNGKYIIRLFVQGRWRQILIDDVVPVGAVILGNTTAAVLPSSVLPNVIWPQLLAKALLRVHQLDNASVLPAVTALTGWLPFRLPFSWELLRQTVNTRPFVSLQSLSQVDLEEPLPNSAGSVASKVGQAKEALCEFLVCELEEEPRQVRLKASTWRPVDGSVRKAVLHAESEAEEEDDEGHKFGDDLDESEHDPADDDEDDEDRATLNSRSAGETAQSPRSKEGTGLNDDGEDGEDGADAAAQPWVNPWPDTMPPQIPMKSALLEHRSQLMDGYWVPFTTLQETCSSFVSYMPPNNIIKSMRDTVWGDFRKQAYIPRPLSVLKLRFVNEIVKRRNSTPDPKKEDAPKGPAWHRAVIFYEPQRLNRVLKESEDFPNRPGSRSFSCLLHCVDKWQAVQPSSGPAPESIYFSVDSTPNSSPAVQSMMLPPGEHWYLVYDDAVHAGSILSIFVEGTLLNAAQSTIEIVDAAEVLESQGAYIATVQPSEYPAHKGLHVWAKTELTLREDVVGLVEELRLMCNLTDPGLWPHLQLTFMLVEEANGDSPETKCAGWTVTRLLHSPVLQITSLPLQTAEPTATKSISEENGIDQAGTEAQGTAGSTATYILMIESKAPFPVKAGSFQMQILLPPSPDGWEAPEADPDQDGGSPGEQQPSEPISLRNLKADHVLRWRGETTPNDKGLVMRERLVVPMGGGDVTGMLRITVTGLPQAALDAALIAQLPPKEETRPRDPNGESPEPLQAGAPIDPRDYNGRRNWLSRCRTVIEESGVEAVVFPHVILREGSTYLFTVTLNLFKGPDTLEGGEWSLDLYGSGEVEAGADTMEQDLEELVRMSWEEPPSEPPKPPRAERAAASRKKWLIEQGILPPPPPVPEEEEVPDPKEKAKKKDQGKGKDKQQPPEEPVEDPAAKAAREAAEFQAALQREEQRIHANTEAKDFVFGITEVEPVLVEEDPYTIAPNPIDPHCTGEFLANEDELERIARLALGMQAQQELRQKEYEESTERWKAEIAAMDAEKERNKTLLEDLNKWREGQYAVKRPFLEEREALRGRLLVRLEKQRDLKDIFNNAESLDVEKLQNILKEAVDAGVETWDGDLVESSRKKVRILEGVVELKGSLEKPPEELFPDEAAKEAFRKNVGELKEFSQQLRKKKVLPEALGEADLLEKAEALVKDPAEPPADA